VNIAEVRVFCSAMTRDDGPRSILARRPALLIALWNARAVCTARDELLEVYAHVFYYYATTHSSDVTSERRLEAPAETNPAGSGGFAATAGDRRRKL
jgi:hypothetical protein